MSRYGLPWVVKRAWLRLYPQIQLRLCQQLFQWPWLLLHMFKNSLGNVSSTQNIEDLQAVGFMHLNMSNVQK